MKRRRLREVDVLLAAASAAGKITPANRGEYLEICGFAADGSGNGNIDSLRRLLATLPVVVNLAPTKTPAPFDLSQLTPRELRLCGERGLDPAKFAAEKGRVQAPVHATPGSEDEA